MLVSSFARSCIASVMSVHGGVSRRAALFAAGRRRPALSPWRTPARVDAEQCARVWPSALPELCAACFLHSRRAASFAESDRDDVSLSWDTLPVSFLALRPFFRELSELRRTAAHVSRDAVSIPRQRIARLGPLDDRTWSANWSVNTRAHWSSNKGAPFLSGHVAFT